MKLQPYVFHAPDIPLIEVVGDQGERLVAINRNGTFSYGDNVDLDDASRRFWEALARNYPGGLYE